MNRPRRLLPGGEIRIISGHEKEAEFFSLAALQASLMPATTAEDTRWASCF